MMSIGDNIRKYRIEKGLTQKQLADLCGVVDATIRTYELGRAEPKPKTVPKIAEALEVTPAELYGVEWIPGIEDQEDTPALYQSLLLGQGSVLESDDPNKVRLMVAFDKLSKQGQAEAIKRIEEMTFVPTYLRLTPTPDGKIVGKKIRQIREQKELTYQGLEELCGLPEDRLRQIELGFVTSNDLKRLGKALGTPNYELLNYTSKEEKAKSDYMQVIELCKEMGYIEDSEDGIPQNLDKLLKSNDAMKTVYQKKHDAFILAVSDATERACPVDSWDDT